MQDLQPIDYVAIQAQASQLRAEATRDFVASSWTALTNMLFRAKPEIAAQQA